MSPDANYGLWVTMTSQHRFLDYKNSSTWWGVGDGGSYLWGKGHVESLLPPLNVAVNLKLL